MYANDRKRTRGRYVLVAPTLYADYQATTPVDPRVVASMEPFWNQAFGNPHSGDHAAGWYAAAAVDEAASAVGALIGADTSEITFTSGATESNNLALIGLARRASGGRRRVLVSAIEHKSVLAAARSVATHEGFSAETIPVDEEGAIRLDALNEMLDDAVLAVSVMAVNNEIGVVQDIAQIAALLRPHGALLHCDAAQAPCAMDTSTLAADADLVSLSGHKMYGPKGIGALYVRHGVEAQIEPLIYGGEQQRGLRSGTVPVPLCAGMGAAAEMLREVGTNERRAVGALRDLFVDKLTTSAPTVHLNGPPLERRHPGNANLRFGGYDAQDILAAVQPHLAASTGAACASGIPEPSHVLEALGLSESDAAASVRFSFGRFTTEDDIVSAVRIVEGALTRLA